MFWDFNDDFWDFDPEDFAIVGGIAGFVDDEMEEKDLLEGELAKYFEEVEDDF